MLAMTTSPYDITPDYTKTVAEAYTRFARRYSPNTQIHVAGLCRRQRQPRSEHAGIVVKNDPQSLVDINDRNYLPSWVPEFRLSLNLVWDPPYTGVYSTATAVPYIFLGDSEILGVMHAGGTIFDIVHVTTCKYAGKRNVAHLAFDPVFYFSLINQLQHILTSSLDPDVAFKPTSEPTWLILAKALTSGVSECEKAEVMLSQYPHFRSLTGLGAGSLSWLTAIWDQFEAHCLSPTGEVFQQILLEVLGGESKTLSTDGEIAFGFLHYVADILKTNRLFVTIDRYLGLAPRDISCGDFIAVFNGLHVPYVVRAAGKVKYKDSAKREERTQGGKDDDLFMTRAVQVIGPCYLHGIMKGEIFTNRDAPQFTRLKWTRYDGDTVDSIKGRLVLI
ncbi:hypothetical protein E0Z10_g3199 [Xylaria hypoxylon]|uniref:Heterokaryon incompatibility domain-containing protein n=1 Tax=Xylaria hypoxylon TaxID=37992 RepID=A0A4Z0Z1H5_9PEZI|nr:hypothetical protein E0Z10_g3199 [Xylaria hypoxylon]